MVLGGLSGLAGNMAGSVAAGGFVMRSAWGIRSVGLGFSSGQMAGASGANIEVEEVIISSE